MGLYGWEPIATAFLEGGRYLTASANHYSLGSYEVDGNVFTGRAVVPQHGEVRTVFGNKKKQFSTMIKGKIKKGGRIVATINPTDDKQFEINMRLSRLGDLD